MPGDEDQILGRDQVRLDIIRPLIDRALIGRQRVFGPFPARAAMGDDQHRILRKERRRQKRQRRQRGSHPS